MRYRSSNSGSSFSESRWVANTRALSSEFIAASTAAIERGRPMVKGTRVSGNKTVRLTGTSGREMMSVFSAAGGVSIFIVTVLQVYINIILVLRNKVASFRYASFPLSQIDWQGLRVVPCGVESSSYPWAKSKTCTCVGEELSCPGARWNLPSVHLNISEHLGTSGVMMAVIQQDCSVRLTNSPPFPAKLQMEPDFLTVFR